MRKQSRHNLSGKLCNQGTYMKNGLGRIPKNLSLVHQKKEKIHQPSPQLVARNDQEEKNVITSLRHVSEPVKKTTQKGLPAGWTRATFIIEEKMNEKIKALAYWERLTVKEIMYEALRDYLKGKQVKPIPQKRIIIHD